MRLSVSDLSFSGFNYKQLEKLSSEYGIEIFYEFGKNDYWDCILPNVFCNRTGTLSIHAPCVSVNLAAEDNEDINIFNETFAYAKKFKADFVVIHTNEVLQGNKDLCQIRVLKKLDIISKLAIRNGVTVAIENVGLKTNDSLLFDLFDFELLLRKYPNFRVLIDTGHAHINGWNLENTIKTFADKIVALHVHDNLGEIDSHLPIGQGTINWQSFFKNTKKITPDAKIILEYANTDIDFINNHLEIIKNKYNLK